VQVDVALDAATALAKDGGPIRGDASILVFPTLAAANIGLKLAEQLGGAQMCTFLTGLARPYNDLSRGCRVDDIVGTAAITALQAAGVAVSSDR
jgi:phosphate acetyltransferase